MNIENLKLVKLRKDGYYELDLIINTYDFKYLIINNLVFNKTQLGVKSRKKWLYTKEAIELINKHYDLTEKPLDYSIERLDGSYTLPYDVIIKIHKFKYLINDDNFYIPDFFKNNI